MLNAKWPFIFIVLILCLYACKKDKNAPVITLNGDTNLEIPIDSVYNDPGAIAIDETDGNITKSITSDWNSVINLSQKATYTVTYRVQDKRANEAKAMRNVIVRLMGSSFIGNYNSAWALTGTSYTGNSFYSISSGTNKNQFVIYPYGPDQIALKVNLSGIYGEILDFNQSDGDVFTEGTGSVENNGSIIKLNFRRAYTNGAVIHGIETITRI